jgi:hypothetical protein
MPWLVKLVNQQSKSRTDALTQVLEHAYLVEV